MRLSVYSGRFAYPVGTADRNAHMSVRFVECAKIKNLRLFFVDLKLLVNC